MVTTHEKRQNNSSVCQNSGSDEQALGALIRMVFAMVGAMRSIVTGVFTRSAFMPAPKMMIGNYTKEARER